MNNTKQLIVNCYHPSEKSMNNSNSEVLACVYSFSISWTIVYCSRCFIRCWQRLLVLYNFLVLLPLEKLFWQSSQWALLSLAALTEKCFQISLFTPLAIDMIDLECQKCAQSDSHDTQYLSTALVLLYWYWYQSQYQYQYQWNPTIMSGNFVSTTATIKVHV